jgi:hypothetical protein
MAGEDLMRRLAWLAFNATLLLAVGAQAQTLERVRATGTFRIGFREPTALKQGSAT